MDPNVCDKEQEEEEELPFLVVGLDEMIIKIWLAWLAWICSLNLLEHVFRITLFESD